MLGTCISAYYCYKPGEKNTDITSVTNHFFQLRGPSLEVRLLVHQPGRTTRPGMFFRLSTTLMDKACHGRWVWE